MAKRMALEPIFLLSARIGFAYRASGIRRFAWEPAQRKTKANGLVQFYRTLAVPHSLRQEKPQLNFQLRFFSYIRLLASSIASQ